MNLLDPLCGEALTAPDDLFLAEFLTGKELLTAAEAVRLVAWWQSERDGAEELVRFLIRRGFLTEAAPIMLDLMREGAVAGDGSRLFRSGAADALRAALPVPQRPPAPVPATKAGTFPPSTTDLVATSLPPDSRPAPVEPARLGPGMTLGKCLLLEKVGQGAAGVVYRALHKSLNIPVAVKLLKAANLERDPAAFERFRDEARLLARLNHPHVTRVWDFEDDPARPYLVLEYVEGLTLSGLIHQSGRLRPDRAVALLTQAAMGLQAARELGIVHRDVKPGNLLLTREGDVKVADLGLALVVNHEEGGETPSGLCGTAAYMAPEQAAASPVLDHRADIYSLGCTFYQMVTGRLPFTCRTSMEYILRHASQEATPPHEVVPDLNPAVSAVAARMMAKRPEDRYPGYDELLDDLAALRDRLSGVPAAPNPASESAAPAGKKSSSMFGSTFRRLFGSKPDHPSGGSQSGGSKVTPPPGR